jgi:hypothetical protein
VAEEAAEGVMLTCARLLNSAPEDHADRTSHHDAYAVLPVCHSCAVPSFFLWAEYFLAAIELHTAPSQGIGGRPS